MFQYPRTKFVDENDFDKQLAHIKSEIEEIEKARTLSNFFEEIIDLQHSVETLIRMVQEGYSKYVDVERFRKNVIEKNRVRGYYTGEDCPAYIGCPGGCAKCPYSGVEAKA